MSTISEPVLDLGLSTNLLHEVLVRISVRGDRLHAYPKRYRDVILYHVARENERRASPVKPRQILFVVDGIPEHRTVTLIPRPGAGEHDEPRRPRVELEHLKVAKHFQGLDAQVFASGPPTIGPADDGELLWTYDIVLTDEHGEELDRIDPPVIIKEEP